MSPPKTPIMMIFWLGDSPKAIWLDPHFKNDIIFDVGPLIQIIKKKATYGMAL